MQVTLLTYTPDPERVVAAAARVCYSAKSGAEIAATLEEEATGPFIAKLLAMGHLSPFEHISFSFAIDGVSRTLSHQLVRHRIASYSQKSQRYVKERGFDYITPPSLAANEAALARYQQLMQEVDALYTALVAQGVPAEDARYILPNATTTNLVATFNARSLLNFFRLRCCRRAQWEIRALAQQMLEEVRQVAPAVFAQAGPSCVSEGVCYEGALSCGKPGVTVRSR